MLSFGSFLASFGWPEFFITLIIVLVIIGVHEGPKVWRLFFNGTKKEHEENGPKA